MTVNSSVNKQFEKMFDIFNKEFFNAELEMPLFRLENHCSKDGAFISDAVINQGEIYSHEIVIPINVLNEKVDVIAACVLHNMIHYYAYMNGYKVSSRGKRDDYYHSKQFKSIADFCGLTSKYNDKSGWTTHTNKKFAEFCKLYGFKKTWNNRYIVDKDTKINNSKKYVCPCCGTIIRATRFVNVVCEDCNEKFVIE